MAIDFIDDVLYVPPEDEMDERFVEDELPDKDLDLGSMGYSEKDSSVNFTKRRSQTSDN